MSSFTRLGYYGRSIITLLTGFRRPLQIIGIFLGRRKIFPAEIEIRRNGWRFWVRSAMDVWIIKETCLDADYLWASGPLLPDWTVLDVGAGLGDFTVLAAQSCPHGVVQAYEPLAESFKLLQQNLALNNIQNVQAFPTGVASQPGKLVMAVAKDAAVSTRFLQSEEDGISAMGLAHILESLPGGNCDFLKIDCEGCEFDILLNSSTDVLRRLQRISLEYHDGFTAHSSQDIVDALQTAGFQVQRQPNPVHTHLGLLYAEQSSPD